MRPARPASPSESTVATKKKTLYEILAVPAHASDAEIQAAYELLSSKLQLQKDQISADDFEFKVKVVNLAFKTLSTPGTRDAYDAKLAASAVPAHPVLPALALVPLQPDAEVLSLRAEAMALRADAMTLRADAMVLRTGSAPFQANRSFSEDSASGLSSVTPILRKILVGLGTLFAIACIAQVVALMVANRRSSMEAMTATQASEKVQIQEYSQTHGVRPANKAELDALVAEDLRKEASSHSVEREKTKMEQDARRFEEESRRRGEQVSADLRTAELQAKEQSRREDERKAWQQKEEARAKDQMERARIEQQKSEWREVLQR